MVKIITDPQNPVLLTPALYVFGKKWIELPKLVKDMKIALKEAKGLGLAAPQIGVSLRVVLLYDGTVMVNPKLVECKGKKSLVNEGCLSIPGRSYLVSRYNEVKVEFQDVNGKPHVDHCVQTDAQLVQHELDHLDGKLICEMGTPHQQK